MKKIKNILLQHREIISYLFWGVLTTVVSWTTFGLFSWLLDFIGMQKDSIVVLIANIFSWIFAMLFAFVTNKVWVFGSKSWKKSVLLPEFGKFVSARLFTGVLEIVMVPLLVELGLNQTIFEVEGMLSKIIVSLAVVILNYVFSKLFIFKTKSV